LLSQLLVQRVGDCGDAHVRDSSDNSRLIHRNRVAEPSNRRQSPREDLARTLQDLEPFGEGEPLGVRQECNYLSVSYREMPPVAARRNGAARRARTQSREALPAVTIHRELQQ
jgi:hypothetical protein